VGRQWFGPLVAIVSIRSSSSMPHPLPRARWSGGLEGAHLAVVYLLVAHPHGSQMSKFSDQHLTLPYLEDLPRGRGAAIASPMDPSDGSDPDHRSRSLPGHTIEAWSLTRKALWDSIIQAAAPCATAA
jgi:hypothetical protein